MRHRRIMAGGTIFASVSPERRGLGVALYSAGEHMEPRNIDAPTSVTLSRLISRQHEDYLDWLENQGRPSWDWWVPVRFLLGLASAGVVTFAAAHLF
jgi:hypothetical protein